MTKPNKYTDEQVAWLKSNQAGISRKELTERFYKRFKVLCSSNQISALCRRHGLRSGVNSGQLKKGDKPWNLGKSGYMGANITSFKKGHKGNNTRPVGSERTCSKDGYVLVKTKEPRKWERKHLVEWRKHYGNLPQGYCLRFLDNDRTNCHISNLVCIHRGANAVINHHNPANTDNPDINHAIILTEQINHTVRNIDKIRSKAHE